MQLKLNLTENTIEKNMNHYETHIYKGISDEIKFKTNIVTSSRLQAEGHVEDEWTMSVHT